MKTFQSLKQKMYRFRKANILKVLEINIIVFDKRQTPHKVSFSLEKNDPLK